MKGPEEVGWDSDLTGASLSEPHINGTSMHEFMYTYMYISLWYVGHPSMHGSMDISVN